MLGNFSFVVDNVLAGSAFPKGDADEVVAELQRHGFKCVVNLTEQPHPAAEALKAAGIDAVHMPVDDFAAPTHAQMDAVAALAVDRSRQPMLVHCRAGIGRTGTMLAVSVHGLSACGQLEHVDDPAAYVRSLRRGSLEVVEQVTTFTAWRDAQVAAVAP